MTERRKETSKEQKKGEKKNATFFFYCLCIRLEKSRKTIAAGRVIYSKYPPPVFRGTLGTTANTTNQCGVISNFFGHWISRGKKKANSFSCWRWQKKLVCCRESAEIGHFNVVMETRCMWQSRRERSHLRATQMVLSFFSQLNCYPLFTFLFWRQPAEWEVKAAAVWVKSPLAQISELCLLGPAASQLPHTHTWRALQRSPLGSIVTHCRTRRSAMAACCYCLLLTQCLKGPMGTFWLELLVWDGIW